MGYKEWNREAPASQGRGLSDESPRERLLNRGAEALSNAELLAVLFRTGRPGASALEAARDVLRQVGGLIGLTVANGDLRLQPGVGDGKASTILAAIELGRRLAREELGRRQLLDDPASVASYLRMRYVSTDQETLGALYLNARHRLIAEGEIFRGTLYRTAVEPRAILKEALLQSAHGVILFHSHPSGDPTPSAEDILFTRRMVEAGELLGVRVIDHLILGSSGEWVSLSRRGFVPDLERKGAA